MESTILAKTRKGHEELAQRSGALAQKQRSMLILIDGKTPCSDLTRKCAFFSDCNEQLAWLLAHGYVEAITAGPQTTGKPVAGAPLISAMPGSSSGRDALIALSLELLGNHADAVVRRLQDTPDNPDALHMALERCHKLIRLSIDEKKAERFLRQGSVLLGPASVSPLP